MAHNQAKESVAITDFLAPLDVTREQLLSLAHELHTTFRDLAATSADQFIPTPITDAILRPAARPRAGRYFAIDIGGTNLRAGWVELPPTSPGDGSPGTRGVRLRERSWPIGEHLKRENAESLFGWIGECIASVIRAELAQVLRDGNGGGDGSAPLELDADGCIPMGVAFSFPMRQHSLAEATLMAMGKGFVITSDLDLSLHLTNGYERAREGGDLPPIKVVAIANDAVATLVSSIHQFEGDAEGTREGGRRRKAVMGVICGTGSNATIPLKLGSLHPDKLSAELRSLPTPAVSRHETEQQQLLQQDVRIAVNTEWSINGTAPPLRALGLETRWDRELDAAGEAPGFQPLEYMTAGRYLGELGRIILLERLRTRWGVGPKALPETLRVRFGLTTTFLSHFRPRKENSLFDMLRRAFPTAGDGAAGPRGFSWTEEMATELYEIAQAVGRRAAGVVAAATIGLLACADELALPSRSTNGGGTSAAAAAAAAAAARTPQQLTNGDVAHAELAVGYTGGCIAHFQDYLRDCQRFLDEILAAEHGGKPPVRVVLYPCHDGGILGAGILVPAALASRHA